jgi:spermidine synthase
MSDAPADGDKPRLMEMPSPFALEPGTVRLLETAGGFTSEQFDRLREGTLGRPFIIDHGRTRNLFFTVSAIQSSMRLDDPHALIAAYTRKMMAFLLFRPAPRHVLMIGLGGGSLAKFCYRHLPRTRITVVEISAEVIALRDAFSIPADDDRFEIIHDDGAAFLANAHIRPDIIMIDAFDEDGVSPALAERGVYRSASQCLTPDGVLVMNLSGEKSRYTAHVESLREAFPGSIRLVPVAEGDNVVLFAFKHRRAAELPDSLKRRAAYLEHGLGLEFSRYLERLRAGHVLSARGDVPV